MTSEEIEKMCEESKGVCILPMGCVEKHGLHMPLGSDVLEASSIAYEASKLETVCVAPDFIFGDVPEMSPNMPAGTVTLTVETEMILLEEICDQIARNGFKKILINNCHGGNDNLIKQFMRKLTNVKKDYVVALYVGTIKEPICPHYMASLLLENGSGYIPELTTEDEELLIKYHKEEMKTGHACMTECALVMAIAPDSVHLDRLGIESGLSNHKADYFAEAGIRIKDGGWGINTPYSFSGNDPVGCNERIGKAALRISAELLAKAVKVYKDDENVLEWHEKTGVV